MRADQDGGRTAMLGEMLDHAAVCGMAEPSASVFAGNGHPQHTHPRQAVDHALRDAVVHAEGFKKMAERMDREAIRLAASRQLQFRDDAEEVFVELLRID